MQSNFNNSIENKTNKIECISVEELLLRNQEILNELILENFDRKEKSYLFINEYEHIKEFESNLIQLIDRCPLNKINEIFAEINNNSLPQNAQIEENVNQALK